jgi:uncharacterized membrane protein
MAIALALSAMVCWSITLILAKPGLARMDAVSYGFIRPIFASVLVCFFGLATSSLAVPDPSVLGMAALGGFIDMFAGVALFMYAMKRVPAHKAGPLSNTAPLWGVIVSVIWLREDPGLLTFVAAGLVVAGSFFLASRDEGHEGPSLLRGALAALGAGFLWGISDTAIAKYCLIHGMTRPTLQLVFMLTAGICWGVLAVAKGRWRRHYYPWNGMKFALTTAFSGMFAGMLLWLLALEMAPASVLSPTRGALTLFVFLLSILVLRERPSRRAAWGVLLVGAGVAIVSIVA